jgi:hypothetical protein
MAQELEWATTHGPESRKTGKDGTFHIHLRDNEKEYDDFFAIQPHGLPEDTTVNTYIKGSLSVTGFERIEDTSQQSFDTAPPALSVRGTLAQPLKGEISVDEDDPWTAHGQYEGTDFSQQVRAGDAIEIAGQVRTIDKVEKTKLILNKLRDDDEGLPAISDVTPHRDSDLFVVQNGAGDANLVVDKSGNVGIGILQPQEKLEVQGNAKFTGKISATEFIGSGANLTNLSAAKITEGELNVERIPNLPASKITDQLTAGQIPGLDANKITTGTLSVERIPNLPASKITSGTISGPVDITGASTTGAVLKVTNSAASGNVVWLEGKNEGGADLLLVANSGTGRSARFAGGKGVRIDNIPKGEQALWVGGRVHISAQGQMNPVVIENGVANIDNAFELLKGLDNSSLVICGPWKDEIYFCWKDHEGKLHRASLKG